MRGRPDAVVHVVAVEDRRQRQGRTHDALRHAGEADTVGENTLARAARRAGHDVRLRALHAERGRREAVGQESDPQQVHRLKDREAEHRRGEDAQHLAHVRAEQELDRTLDVVINASVEIESLTGVLCVIPFELIIIIEFDEIPEAISPLTERFGIK